MSTPPTRKQLPRHLDPRKLVTAGSSLNGEASTAEMERLGDAVESAAPYARVSLDFGRDEMGNATVSGSVALEVELECQRCLMPVGYSLAGTFSLGIVWDEEQAKNLPKRLEPWIVGAESADLYDMVEDELLLTLPIVAYHKPEECKGTRSYSTGDVEDTAENPFGILAQLKKRQ
ncbi:MAG: nucleic acid-binding protein [Porticoccaceae bacterium]|nr:nucleic acid-binding protein [Porticoccaceae bacterium]